MPGLLRTARRDRDTERTVRGEGGLMCGIFGFVAGRPRSADEVVDGLRYLEYRGYDSWGVAVALEGTIASEKAVGPITAADVHLPDAVAALGHTRWATHGGVT